MQIVVEASDYILRNIGDIAMQQVAVARLNALFPEATIQVFTEDPAGLAVYCPEAIPLATSGRQAWLGDGHLLGPLYQFLPGNLAMKQLREVERTIHRRCPSLVERVVRLRMKHGRYRNNDLNDYLETISHADLVVLGGVGGLTDDFEYYALGVLGTLGMAIGRGVPTVMFSQGIGPIQTSRLKAHAKAVLPHVNLIALREGRVGGTLLTSLGVSSDRILITGDDAIELAYQAYCDQLGHGLGVNLRAAGYSEVDQTLVEQIRPVLQDIARRYNAPLLPVPISRVPGEEDAFTIQQLIAEYHPGTDGGAQLDTPSKVIEQISRCRLVVTGSYHGAVFALGQGVPAIGLAKSNYYIDKFLGLAQQFGTGCEVICLKEAESLKRLPRMIEKMWDSADQMRPQLLTAAARQVELSRAAYRQVYELINFSS